MFLSISLQKFSCKDNINGKQNRVKIRKKISNFAEY